MKDYFGYNEKICVVTGASSGMGKAAAEMLVDLGAKVYALDWNVCEVAGIEKFVKVNLAEKESIDACFAELPETIDCFFGIAGVSGIKTDFNTTMAIDLFANTYITEEYLTKRMGKGGAIAYITSTGGILWADEGNKKYYMPLIEAKGWENKKAVLEAMNLNALPGTLAYLLAKCAMNYYVAYQQSRMVEMGVRVNALLPGSTNTGMKDEFQLAAGGEDKLLASAGHAHILAVPEEMGEPVVFLNSNMARFISGELLVVDYGAVIEEQAGLAKGATVSFDTIIQMIKARQAQ
ncbi:MAG: SDR family oxidoreductase [Solobacterium sp.]|nr:SDR family oxidoreductase [Solobacterium sp.]